MPFVEVSVARSDRPEMQLTSASEVYKMFVIPGNDDAARAIALYCDLVSKAVIDGLASGRSDMGVDVGEAVEPMPEVLPDTSAAVEEAPAAAETETEQKAE